MIEIVWEFIVKPENRVAFEEAYGPSGAWAKLFGEFTGYRGTTLSRDSKMPDRYLTIDRWESFESREEMLSRAGDRYSQLDAEFESLTVAEREIGRFETVE